METPDDNKFGLMEEYNRASGNNYHSGDVTMMLPVDYTDFFIYAVHRGYDPRTFHPIDAYDTKDIENYIIGRKVAEEINRQQARVLQSLLLDLTPFVGQAKVLVEMALGENLVTGEELTGWDYGFGAAGAIFPAIKGG